jgi:hypothetical protein
MVLVSIAMMPVAKGSGIGPESVLPGKPGKM